MKRLDDFKNKEGFYDRGAIVGQIQEELYIFFCAIGLKPFLLDRRKIFFSPYVFPDSSRKDFYFSMKKDLYNYISKTPIISDFFYDQFLPLKEKSFHDYWIDDTPYPKYTIDWKIKMYRLILSSIHFNLTYQFYKFSFELSNKYSPNSISSFIDEIRIPEEIQQLTQNIASLPYNFELMELLNDNLALFNIDPSCSIKGYNSNLSVESCETLYIELTTKGFIDTKTDKDIFIAIFSGKEVQKTYKIKWTYRQKNLLPYLIDNLIGGSVENERWLKTEIFFENCENTQLSNQVNSYLNNKNEKPASASKIDNILNKIKS